MSLMLHEMLLGDDEGSLEPLLVASNTSNAATVTYPAGIQAGDLIVLVDRASSGLAAYPGKILVAGFTELSSTIAQLTVNSAGRQRLTVSYQIATGPLTGSITGQNGAVAEAKVLMVFRKANGSPITAATPTLLPTTREQATFNAVLTTTIPAGTFPASTFFFSAQSTFANAATVQTQTASGISTGSLTASNDLTTLYGFTSTPNPTITITSQSNKVPVQVTAAGITIT